MDPQGKIVPKRSLRPYVSLASRYAMKQCDKDINDTNVSRIEGSKKDYRWWRLKEIYPNAHLFYLNETRCITEIIALTPYVSLIPGNFRVQVSQGAKSTTFFEGKPHSSLGFYVDSDLSIRPSVSQHRPNHLPTHCLVSVA